MSEQHPAVEVVLPVHNAEHDLPGRVTELRAFLEDWFPYRWQITIADGASTDGTRQVAERLAGDGVAVRHLPRQGRGLALRTVLADSAADVVVFLEADLADGLDDLVPLVVPLVLGHSDVAIRATAARPADTARLPRVRRGVRAVRTAAVSPVLAEVRDDGTLFDTELLQVADRHDLRVHEVPQDRPEHEAEPGQSRRRPAPMTCCCLPGLGVAALATAAAAVLSALVFRRIRKSRECRSRF